MDRYSEKKLNLKLVFTLNKIKIAFVAAVDSKHASINFGFIVINQKRFYEIATVVYELKLSTK